VKITLGPPIFAAVALAAALGAALSAALSLGVSPSRAGTYGDQPWCAVHDEGAGNVNWDCEFASVDDCSPAVLVGNRGFCARNPYWQPPPPPPGPQLSTPPAKRGN